MKKILTGLVLSFIVAGLIIPVIGLAQPEGVPGTCFLRHNLTDINAGCTVNTAVSVEDYPMCCLFNTIYTVTDWVFYILLAIVVIMMVWGGLFYVTAAGDPEKAGKGKQIIVYAIVGLIIALLARLAPAVIRFVMGV